MTTATDLLCDGFIRVKNGVHAVVQGLTLDELCFRPDPQANTIAWLVWHLTRIQDDHIAAAAGMPQVWHTDGWAERFGLPFDRDDTGYGQDPEEVAAVRVDGDLLVAYHDAVAAKTAAYIEKLNDEDMTRVVDRRWDPPVTLAVRLVSVLADDLQHVGQAAYVRGLTERR